MNARPFLKAARPAMSLNFTLGGPRRLTFFILISKSAYVATPAKPLIRTNIPHRFFHRPAMSHNPKKVNSGGVSSSPTDHVGPILDHPLSQKCLLTEPSMVQSLAERIRSNPAYKQQLLDIVELSRTDPQASRAAANALTILVMAKVRLNGAGLRGIRVSGADLSEGQFDSAQLQVADLTGANLNRTWILQADFSNTRLEGVRFGELPIVREPRSVARCAFSPDGKTFAVAFHGGSISIKIYDTSTWSVIQSLRGHTDELTSIAYSPCGRKLVSGCGDRTARLWDC